MITPGCEDKSAGSKELQGRALMRPVALQAVGNRNNSSGWEYFVSRLLAPSNRRGYGCSEKRGSRALLLLCAVFLARNNSCGPGLFCQPVIPSPSN